MSTISTPANGALDYSSLKPAEDPNKPLWLGLSAVAWVKIAIVAALLVALFRFNLARLWSKTNPINGDANWGHTPIIPLIGLYYLFLNRDQLLAATVKPIFFERPTRNRLIVSGIAVAAGALAYFAGGAILGVVLGQSDTVATLSSRLGMAAAVWGVFMLALGWGVGNVLFGLLVFAVGIYPGKNDWVTDYGMVHTIFGTVLMLCGWEVMRVAWFPIAFLVCGIPWPGQLYSWLASPLQHLAATVAVKMLNTTGIDSIREGTKMFIRAADGSMRPLNVAEACAGLRSLMTFISVAAAVAFLSQRTLWQKAIITFSAIPIAIFCNVMRVTGQAYLDRLAGPQWSENFAHQFVGLVMLIPAFFLILLVAWLVDKLVIEEVDEKTRYKAAAAAKAVGAGLGNKKVIVVGAKPATAPSAGAVAPVAAKPQAAVVAAAKVSAPAPAKAATPAPVTMPAKAAIPAPVKAPAPAQVSPAPVAPAAPKAPAAKLPPRTNLTGKPDRSVEGR